MTKRRVLRWLLIVVVLAAFGVWLEPTRVVWGWLRGEAFYQGRPTSYWREELSRWRPWGHIEETAYFARSPTKFEEFLAEYELMNGIHRRSVTPPLLTGDPDALRVLEELSCNAVPPLSEVVDQGLTRIRNGWKAAKWLNDWSVE